MSLINKLKEIFNKNEKDLDSYDKGLTKTRDDFISKLNILNKKHKSFNDEYFEELEELFIMADIGVNMTMAFMEKLKARVKKEGIKDLNLLTEIIIDELFIIYVNDEILSNKTKENNNGPTVFLFVGVNGVGKTTTIGKIAHKFIKDNKRVLMIAGDTFRAGAIEQIQEWGNKVGCKVISKENADPSSVIYTGIEKAIEEKYDIVLIDTAGRLQNKTNLMNELGKINKVINKLVLEAPHETLLVIDATTGQNAISQAKAFKEITNVTGIVLTKLDGTAKGGIVLSIKESVNIPVKYIGLGEKMEDLKEFDIEKYIYGLFKDMM